MAEIQYAILSVKEIVNLNYLVALHSSDHVIQLFVLPAKLTKRNNLVVFPHHFNL
jgi:hypothetical protein